MNRLLLNMRFCRTLSALVLVMLHSKKDGNQAVFCAAFASTTSTASSSSSGKKSVWEDETSSSLKKDPPPSEILALIRKRPYRGGFEPAQEVCIETPKIVSGSIPTDLVGSLATAGPGRIRIGQRQYGHWFDGDGYVTLLTLNGKTATFSGHYVRTTRFEKQQALMQRLEDSTNPPFASAGAWTLKGSGKWFQNIFAIPTNPANTATLWLPPQQESSAATPPPPPRLYALCEGGYPIPLHPSDGTTIGPETPFTSQDGTSLVADQSFFSAHFSKCPVSGEMYNHGYVLKPGPGQKYINLMKMDRHGNLLHQAQSPLPYDTFVHDAVLSQNYIVYFLCPYHTPAGATLKALAGLKAFGDLYEWAPDKLPAYCQVHSRNDLSLIHSIPLPNPMSLYHMVDAFEDGPLLKVRVAELCSNDPPADRVTLEAQFADNYRVEGPRLLTKLREYVFQGDTVISSGQDVAHNAALCEFPVLNPCFQPTRRRRYCWTNAVSSPDADYLDGIQKIDMERGEAGPVVTFGEESYSGAPTFVPRPEARAEDDGYILATVYRALEHRSDIVILDASTMKTLCVMELQQHVPYQFHGEFVSGYVGDKN